MVACRSKVNSKAKGARFERTLASRLREYGYDCRRGQQYSGANGDADVVGLRGLHIEAKHQETMRLYEWVSQAKRDSEGTGKLPAVFHKKNNAEILVTMTLDDWINLYREWEAGFDFEE
jgi:Holliday junction resolvase